VPRQQVLLVQRFGGQEDPLDVLAPLVIAGSLFLVGEVKRLGLF
jgi:hypothetical protein